MALWLFLAHYVIEALKSLVDRRPYPPPLSLLWMLSLFALIALATVVLALDGAAGDGFKGTLVFIAFVFMIAGPVTAIVGAQTLAALALVPTWSHGPIIDAKTLSAQTCGAC
jgi:hypothetical protein